MRILGFSYHVIVPIWLFIGIIVVTSTTLASPLKSVNGITTCRDSNEKEQCRAECSDQALQPLCIEQQCICDSIGVRDCSENRSQACSTFCETLNNQKFVGCYKDECICDEDKL
ncbi:hypothetical protein BDC45DRAFT_515964 [Circinella umbellata]|nr:hypothetical protein BDC45DRAFT_515964 [Circinella umbellata]